MSENDSHTGKRFDRPGADKPSKLLTLKEIRRTMTLSPKGIAHMFQVIKNNRKKQIKANSIEQLIRDTRRYYGLPSEPGTREQNIGRIKTPSRWRGQP